MTDGDALLLASLRAPADAAARLAFADWLDANGQSARATAHREYVAREQHPRRPGMYLNTGSFEFPFWEPLGVLPGGF